MNSVKYKNRYLLPGSCLYNGKTDDAVRFTMAHQLLDSKLWQNFVEVFRHDSDSEDRGWRDEYWGKMMRGACLTYMYEGGEQLYNTIEASVKDMLSVPTHDGAVTTYNEETAFSGWDMWGRKYVLTGLQHFYHICKDEELKSCVIHFMCAHADNIIKNVGNEEGKKNITETSNFWLGVNSCSIIEPFVELYKLTGQKKYMDFAEYIIDTGGCSGGDLISLAYENELMPYMYPETKAYETMSFFEGILAYYEVTGKAYYLTAAERFFEAVKQTDITIIGCSGCTHELFDNSAVKQTEYSDGIMQETCVTVTWMRLNARLYMLTGKKDYYDNIEISGYNALYGSMNINNLPQLNLSRYGNEPMPPLPFDSYSPLYRNRRGRGVGGLKRFSFGGHYGCCACIASAGIALMPLLNIVENDNGILINGFAGGKTETSYASFSADSSYPAEFDYRLVIDDIKAEEFDVKIRIPDFSKNINITVNGKEICSETVDGYATLSGKWSAGDTISVRAVQDIRPHILNGKVAYTYGPLVLARDKMKEENGSGEVHLLQENTSFTKEKAGNNEIVRFSAQNADGTTFIFSDYESCGNDWSDEDNIISVWFDK